VRIILRAGVGCRKCRCCEEWLPGFIRVCGGIQVVCREQCEAEIWEAICAAMASCPEESLFYQELK
jgi:hypothetical protein